MSRAKRYITEPNGYLEPTLGTGVAGWDAKTVIDVFQETVRKHGDKPALCFKTPKNVSCGKYVCLSTVSPMCSFSL